MELKFSECSLISLEKLFGLEALDDCPALQAWLTADADISAWERTSLEYFRQLLRHNAHSWNEIELIQLFIGQSLRWLIFPGSIVIILRDANYAAQLAMSQCMATRTA